ncbi:MAG: Phosphoribosyltransferase [Candidatus Magasanikbacteria bacterium GW2011_GWA2_40_10]|uniref:Phosphoribosyltransferase n=1 Tax=Candidatus Magasanikbacteria bacterium GW2011_GWA2_40_10 TaxID=1619037 RepID=A0A0G0TCD2_9BACT|nr:MAG: Phosphoribosyltransferase [Candidatus Magasanikbacteria bacterium GW2011_GWA2_40_10]
MSVATHKFYKKNKGEVKITWQDVERDTLHIVHAMAKSRFKPDMIISLARSGLIPAAMISYCLGNKQLYVIKADFSKTQLNGSVQDLRSRPVLSQRIKRSLKGLKILVVDEMTVSGETLKLVSKYLQTKHPRQVKYAVLYRQPWSQFKPDYFGRKITFWPLFPWKELRNNVKDPRAKLVIAGKVK